MESGSSRTTYRDAAGTNGRSIPLFVHWQALSPFLPWTMRSTPRPLVPDEGKEIVGRFRLALGSAPFRCSTRPSTTRPPEVRAWR